MPMRHASAMPMANTSGSQKMGDSLFSTCWKWSMAGPAPCMHARPMKSMQQRLSSKTQRAHLQSWAAQFVIHQSTSPMGLLSASLQPCIV